MDIDPVEFFAFFADFDGYPTNGFRLAQTARERGFSQELVAFFQGMPGEFATESEVLPLAEDPGKPPWGAAVEGTTGRAPAPGESLTLKDITKGED